MEASLFWRKGEVRYTKKYVCIHCKLEVSKLPPLKSNECPYGYNHAFIKPSAIIEDALRPLKEQQ